MFDSLAAVYIFFYHRPGWCADLNHKRLIGKYIWLVREKPHCSGTQAKQHFCAFDSFQLLIFSVPSSCSMFWSKLWKTDRQIHLISQSKATLLWEVTHVNVWFFFAKELAYDLILTMTDSSVHLFDKWDKSRVALSRTQSKICSCLFIFYHNLPTISPH